MYPTLFTFGRLNVPTYTVLLDLGLILALVLTYLEGKRLLQKGSLALDLGLWSVIGGILGGRLGYVIANWEAFSENWTRALRLWEGGLSFHGAFLAGLLVLFVFTELQRDEEHTFSFWIWGDVLTPGMALGIAFGWAANLLAGSTFGKLGEGFGSLVLPDVYGIAAPRFATQLVGLVFSLILFVTFWLLRKKWPWPGASFLMFLLLYFTGQFFLEFTRGDEAIMLGPWRITQVIDLAIILSSAAGLMVLWRQGQQAGKEDQAAVLDESEATSVEISKEQSLSEEIGAEEVELPST